MNRTDKIKKITFVAMMTALAITLSFVQIPYPIAPYMKFDPNDIVILISVVYLGYRSSIVVAFLRSAIRFILTGGIFGEIAALCSSLIFMSVYALFRYLYKKTNMKSAVSYAFSCVAAIIVATIGLMSLNYIFITPSNITQNFTTGWQLMELWGLSKASYFRTFIIPVMTFNLIKWSLISFLTGVTQIKLPERFSRRFDSLEQKEIFLESSKITSKKPKEETEELKEDNI